MPPRMGNREPGISATSLRIEALGEGKVSRSLPASAFVCEGRS